MTKYNLRIFFFICFLSQIRNDDDENIQVCSTQLKSCRTIAITLASKDELCVVCPRGQEILCPCLISLTNRIRGPSPNGPSTPSTNSGHPENDDAETSSISSNNSTKALDFGLIVGITVTTFLFLIITLVILIVFLIRNYRKAASLKKEKDSLELDLKLKTTMTLSALLNQSNNNSTLNTPTNTPLRGINLTADLQERLNNNTAASTPNHLSTLLPAQPLEFSNLNNQVYYDYDNQRRNSTENNARNQVNESSIDEGASLPVNFASPNITGEKVHFNSGDININIPNGEALPTYNSIFRQLSQDL
jgi:hypothetical protein